MKTNNHHLAALWRRAYRNDALYSCRRGNAFEERMALPQAHFDIWRTVAGRCDCEAYYRRRDLFHDVAIGVIILPDNCKVVITNRRAHLKYDK